MLNKQVEETDKLGIWDAEKGDGTPLCSHNEKKKSMKIPQKAKDRTVNLFSIILLFYVSSFF